MSSSDEHWNRLCAHFLTWTGMNLPLTMRSTAEILIAREAEKSDCDIATFLEKADEEPEIRQIMLDEIGLGTTWFMRDEAGLRTLVRSLVRHSSRDKTIWVWSAGCSTGEEAYSLTMALADEGVKVRVLGSDLNSQAIERARTGIYSQRSLRHVPKSWFWRYFDEVDGNFQVKPEIRRTVSFELHNLITGRFPPTGWFRFDAVVCRNVLLYFDQDEALQIISSMAGACRPRGFLLLGAIERPIFWMSDLVDRDQAGELVQVFPSAEPDGKPEFMPVDDLRKHTPRVARAYPSGDEVVGDDPNELLDRADLERKAGRLDSALSLIDAAISVAPTSAPAHLARGLLLKQLNRIHDAVESLRASRFLDSQSWLAPYQLALCLDAIGDNNDALEAYRHALGVLRSKGTSGLHKPSDDVDMLVETAAEVCRGRIEASA